MYVYTYEPDKASSSASSPWACVICLAPSLRRYASAIVFRPLRPILLSVSLCVGTRVPQSLSLFSVYFSSHYWQWPRLQIRSTQRPRWYVHAFVYSGCVRARPENFNCSAGTLVWGSLSLLRPNAKERGKNT